jgi:hypothetical protein
VTTQSTETRRSPEVLYKYLSPEGVRAVLGLRRLRFRAPRDFNDPCDGQLDPLHRLYTFEAASARENEIRSILSHGTPLRPGANPRMSAFYEKLTMLIDELPRDLRDAQIANAAKEIVEQNDLRQAGRNIIDSINANRILCLSELATSMLMWSHYASGHRGAVLGFEPRTLIASTKALLWPVEYKNETPDVIDWAHYNICMVHGVQPNPPSTENARKLVLTKSREWEYEKEWRGAISAGPSATTSHRDVEYSGNCLVELVRGIRTNDDDFEIWQSVAQEISPSIRIRTAVLDVPTFSITIQD